MRNKLIIANAALLVLVVVLFSAAWYQGRKQPQAPGQPNQITQQLPQVQTPQQPQQQAQQPRQEGRQPQEPAPELNVSSENTIAAFGTQNKPGKRAIVALAVLSKGGFAVIHRSEAGQPGKIIGASSYLEPGQHLNTEIALSEAVSAGDSLFAVLHKDNGDQTFSPQEDSAVTREGETVQYRFEVGQ